MDTHPQTDSHDALHEFKVLLMHSKNQEYIKDNPDLHPLILEKMGFGLSAEDSIREVILELTRGGISRVEDGVEYIYCRDCGGLLVERGLDGSYELCEPGHECSAWGSLGVIRELARDGRVPFWSGIRYWLDDYSPLPRFVKVGRVLIFMGFRRSPDEVYSKARNWCARPWFWRVYLIGGCDVDVMVDTEK